MRRVATAVAVLVMACTPTVSPSPTQTAITPNPPIASPAPTLPAVPSSPAISIKCRPESAPQPALGGDPCPGAISAVELAVAPVELPIERIVVEPGPFYCDVIWPGAMTAPACYGTLVIPGQYMHAWVRFVRSEEVAAVMLGRDLPADLSVPAPTPLPWLATLVAVELPPTGWVMP